MQIKYSLFEFAICLANQIVKYKNSLPIDYVYSVAKHVNQQVPSIDAASFLLNGTDPGT